MNDIFDILISLLSHWSASPSCPRFISCLCVMLLKKCQWIDRQAFCGEITLICCCDKCSEVLSSSLPVLPHLNSQGHISKALCLSVCLTVRLSVCLPSLSMSLYLSLVVPPSLGFEKHASGAASNPVLISQQKQQSMLNDFHSVASQSRVN